MSKQNNTHVSFRCKLCKNISHISLSEYEFPHTVTGVSTWYNHSCPICGIKMSKFVKVK
jgi:hypothetical protein